MLTNKLRHTNATRCELIISRFVSLSRGKTLRYYSSRIHRTSVYVYARGSTCRLLVFQLPDWMLTFSLRRIIRKRLLFKGKCHFYGTFSLTADILTCSLTRERAPVNHPFYALNRFSQCTMHTLTKIIARLVY